MRTILSTLLFAAFLLPGAILAQHDRSASSKLSIPSSIQIEHEQIHRELSGLLKLGGETGRAAHAVADALHEHFELEEELAMPPLGALQEIVKNANSPHRDQLLKLSEELERRLPEMLGEHRSILQKIEALRIAARSEAHFAALEFADTLELHALNEEQILYPTAILIGKYLRLQLSSR